MTCRPWRPGTPSAAAPTRSSLKRSRLAAGEALLASARLHQLDELGSTDDALRAEADEVAETISQNEDLSERGLLPLDWILHAFEWAAEARQSLRIRDRGSRGEPLHGVADQGEEH